MEFLIPHSLGSWNRSALHGIEFDTVRSLTPAFTVSDTLFTPLNMRDNDGPTGGAKAYFEALPGNRKLNVRSLKDSETKMCIKQSVKSRLQGFSSELTPTRQWHKLKEAILAVATETLLNVHSIRLTGLTATTKKARSWFKRRIRSTQLVLKM